MLPDPTLLQEALSEPRAKPSRGRHAATVLTRVSALAQPTGRSVPQLIPDGFTPGELLQIALRIKHPFTWPVVMPEYIIHAGQHQSSSPSQLSRQRLHVLSAVKTLAEVCEDEDKLLCSLSHPFLQPVVEKRHLAFLRELSCIAAPVDRFLPWNTFVDYR